MQCTTPPTQVIDSNSTYYAPHTPLNTAPLKSTHHLIDAKYRNYFLFMQSIDY